MARIADRRTTVFLVGALAVGAVALAREAAAHFTFTVNPLYASSTCSTALAYRRNPVNIVLSSHATAERSRNHVAFHTGWSPSVGPTRYLRSHGTCGAATWRIGQLADSATRKFLMDGRETADAGLLYGVTTMATPRRVKRVTCAWVPYSLEAFDQGREEVWLRMRASSAHRLVRTYPGNTQSFNQCDGSKPASDGIVYFVTVPDADHP